MSFLDLFGKKQALEKERDLNKKLHCNRVAAKYQREIDKIDEQIKQIKKQ